DPTTLLGSLLLMLHHQVKSITDWVQLTRSDPLLALLAGFDPDKTPGVGTYYDFLHRLMDGPYQKPCPHTHQRSSLLKRSYSRSLDHEADQKQPTHDPNHPQSKALAQDLLQNPDPPRPNNFYKVLEDLFIQLALIPSLQQGHLKPQNLTVSGDGSALESRASSHPRSLCSCRKSGIYRCSCPKAYTSSTARWCWDQYHKVFKFGDRFYHLVTTQDGHDFPLLTHMAGGNESDHTLSLKTLDRFLKASSQHHLPVSISHFTADGHHDNSGFYDYLGAKLIIPVIPLNEHSKNSLIHLEGLRLTDQGVPLCPEGAEMRHHALNDQRHIYACPAKRLTHRNGQAIYVFRPELCPINQDCKPQSPQGPWVSIPME
ncbi:MAG: hypothetical protein L0Y56_15440, partial [Nitrospira sp.]|nr:hypothetical protein [Nitrospira sp.]